MADPSDTGRNIVARFLGRHSLGVKPAEAVRRKVSEGRGHDALKEAGKAGEKGRKRVSMA